jgi:hypothetical protein
MEVFFMYEQIGAMVLAFVQGSPKLAGVLSILYIVAFALRLLRPVIAQVIALTPSKSDDAALAKAEESKAFKVAAYLLDLVIRFKVKA